MENPAPTTISSPSPVTLSSEAPVPALIVPVTTAQPVPAAVASPAETHSTDLKVPTGHEKIWITILHLSVIAGVGLLVPLVLFLLKKHGTTVTAHAKEASNFHLSLLLYVLIFGALAFVVVGVPVALGILVLGWLWGAVCSLFAAHHGVKGKPFRYPLTLRLIK